MKKRGGKGGAHLSAFVDAVTCRVILATTVILIDEPEGEEEGEGGEREERGRGEGGEREGRGRGEGGGVRTEFAVPKALMRSPSC